MPEAAARLDQPGHESVTGLFHKLRELGNQVGNGLTHSEFGRCVLNLLETHDKYGETALEDDFLAVLARQGCSGVLLAEVRSTLVSKRPIRTVRRAASNARKNESTLQRHWKVICSRRRLHDLVRLTVLVHLAREKGSDRERAGKVGIDVRTARKAALELTHKPLSHLMAEPSYDCYCLGTVVPN